MASACRDLVIIGAGPTALTAATYTAREDIDTIVYEKSVVGGVLATIDKIDNYPGFAEGVPGMKLASDMKEQAERFGAEVDYGEVSSLKVNDDKIELIVDSRPVLAKAVLIASGNERRKLSVPGEAELAGRGVHYCATCDGAFYRDKHLIVIGGGNSGVQEAIFLTRFATKIDLLVRSRLRASEILKKELQKHVDDGKIAVHIGVTIDEIIESNGKFAGVKAKQNEESLELTADGLFVLAGSVPKTEFLKDSGIELDEDGRIVVNDQMSTNLPGVFAGGDVRSRSVLQVASAVGDGATAAIAIREYLSKIKG